MVKAGGSAKRLRRRRSLPPRRPAPAALHGEPVGMHDQTKEDMRTHPVLAITGQSNDTLERKQCVTIDVIAVIVHKHSQVM